MVMSWFWILTLSISILCAASTGRGAFLAASVLEGAQAGIMLAISLAGSLCLWSGVANLLGLGNAATPMGIRAAKCMKQGYTATDELCRLIVLNTASIQLIPANVAAIRSSFGCATPFDILLPVWVSSLCSAAFGIGAAWILGKVCRR